MAHCFQMTHKTFVRPATSSEYHRKPTLIDKSHPMSTSIRTISLHVTSVRILLELSRVQLSLERIKDSQRTGTFPPSSESLLPTQIVNEELYNVLRKNNLLDIRDRSREKFPSIQLDPRTWTSHRPKVMYALIMFPLGRRFLPRFLVSARELTEETPQQRRFLFVLIL